MEYLNWKLNRINLESGYGYISMPDGVFHFYQKDHLGNVRLVVNQDGTVEQTNHYYPYGMSFAEGDSCWFKHLLSRIGLL